MSDLVCIRSSVLVKQRDLDRAFRLEVQSIVPRADAVGWRERHEETIVAYLATHELIFNCSIGSLHHQTMPTQGFTEESHEPVQVEEVDLSF